jgi:hypothetical protein
MSIKWFQLYNKDCCIYLQKYSKNHLILIIKSAMVAIFRSTMQLADHTRFLDAANVVICSIDAFMHDSTSSQSTRKKILCSTTPDLCHVARKCIQRHTADAAPNAAIRSSRVAARRSASSAQEMCGLAPSKWQDSIAPISSSRRISSPQPPPPPPFTASASTVRRFRLR